MCNGVRSCWPWQLISALLSKSIITTSVWLELTAWCNAVRPLLSKVFTSSIWEYCRTNATLFSRMACGRLSEMPLVFKPERADWSSKVSKLNSWFTDIPGLPWDDRRCCCSRSNRLSLWSMPFSFLWSFAIGDAARGRINCTPDYRTTSVVQSPWVCGVSVSDPGNTTSNVTSSQPKY